MHPLGQAALGLLLADFLVAAVHWYEDVYLPYSSSDTLLGQISRDNEMHHFVPYAITAGSWLDNMQVTAPFSLALGFVLLLVAPGFVRRNPVFVAVLVGTLATSNLLHRFWHERDCHKPGIVQILQRAGIMCSSQQHRQHHVTSHEKYGVVLGFTNVFYDNLGVWKALEALGTLLGARTHKKPGVGAYEPHYDAWLRDNLQRPCPERITKARMQRLREQLAGLHPGA